MKRCINLDQDESPNWLERELEGSEFRDKQICSRILILMGQLWKGLGTPILLVYQDWVGTKAVSEHNF